MEIAQLRKVAISANRTFSRARRSGNATRIDAAWENRKVARKELASAIRTAKTEAWEEAIKELDNDPWGRPYKTVMKKLRVRTPPHHTGDGTSIPYKCAEHVIPSGRNGG